MSDHKHKSTGAALKPWLPVLTLSLCTFIFSTSEFIPIALLVSIGESLGTSEAQTGWLVTAYAWMVAILSLPLMVLASKIEMRRLMLMIVGLFFASQLVASVAANYGMLLVARVGVACSHAIFWSMVTPLAVEVAPERRSAAALSIVMMGSSIAMIFGLPFGRLLGLWLGWRMSFLTIALLAAIVLLCLYKLFPKVPSRHAVTLREVPKLLSSRILLGICIMTPIMITGNFTLYSYIVPFLGQTAHLSPGVITWMIATYGGVGIVTSWLFSRYYDRYSRAFFAIALVGLAASLLLVKAATASAVTVFALCLLWGFCVASFNLTFQAIIIASTPKGTTVAMSAYSGIYNIGIGLGALVGGLVLTHFDIGAIGYAGGSIATLGALWGLLFVLPAAVAVGAIATTSRYRTSIKE